MIPLHFKTSLLQHLPKQTIPPKSTCVGLTPIGTNPFGLEEALACTSKAGKIKDLILKRGKKGLQRVRLCHYVVGNASTECNCPGPDTLRGGLGCLELHQGCLLARHHLRTFKVASECHASWLKNLRGSLRWKGHLSRELNTVLSLSYTQYC